MFGVNKVAQDLKHVREDVHASFEVLSRRLNAYERMINERLTHLDRVFAEALPKRDNQIAKLERQIRQMAGLAGFKITNPSAASEGGEVRKFTEEELEHARQYNRLFSLGYGSYLNASRQFGKSMVSDLTRGTSKKVSKKKKK